MRLLIAGFLLLVPGLWFTACGGDGYVDSDPVPLALPSAGPPPGVYTNDGDFQVFLRSDAPGGTLHWSVDGGESWLAQQTNQVNIGLDGSLMVLSYVTAAGRVQSYTNVFSYRLCLPEPQIDPAGGVYTNAGSTNLTLSSGASGATLFWSTNGGAVWDSVVTNSLSIRIADNAEVLAYVGRDGFVDSTTNRQAFRFWRWRALGKALLSEGPVEGVRLAAHRDGPLVAYRDVAASRATRIVVHQGTGWTNLAGHAAPEPVPGLELVVDGASVSLGEGVPPVLRSYRAGAWATIGEFPSDPVLFEGFRLAGEGGRFWLAAVNRGTDRVRVMHWDGGAWESFGEVGSVVSNAGVAVLDMQVAEGLPYVAWRDERRGGRASVARRQNGGWTNVGAAGFTAGTAFDVRLAVGRGVPYLACVDSGRGNRLAVYACREGQWTNLAANGVTAGVASDPVLAIDRGKLFVATRDAGRAGGLFVYQLSDDAWSIIGSGPVSAGRVSHPALAVVQGRVVVAYRDENQGGRLAVRRFSD